jgi:hypothetical protein
MFGILNKDVCSIIQSDFNPIDLYRLKCINKYHYMYIKNDDVHELIIRNIIFRLKDILEDNYEVFISLMQKNKINISGSFIIQCALNEKWTNSDIDLYTYSSIAEDFHLPNMKLHKNLIYQSDSPYQNIPGIKEIINYYNENNGVTFQIIQLCKTETFTTISTYINETYDFDICKNTYKIKNNQHVLKIKNLSGIMHKKIITDTINCGRKIRERFTKYSTRGFEFLKTQKYDYLKFNNKVIPLVIRDGTKILFLGQEMNNDKWENENVIIYDFNNITFNKGDICDDNGVIVAYDDDNNIIIKNCDKYNIRMACPIYNHYEKSFHYHRHAYVKVYHKKMKKKYMCDVIVIDHDEKFNIKNPIQDDYQWLNIRISSKNKIKKYYKLMDDRTTFYELKPGYKLENI